MGCLYFNGTYVEQDYAQAFHYFQLAADQGVAGAQYSVGLCYQNGWGVDKNIEQAVVWYEKAAEQNYAPAYSDLQTLATKEKIADAKRAFNKLQRLRKI